MIDDDDLTRTAAQNRKMWPMLTDISRQKKWSHTRRGEWVTDFMPNNAWKSVLTAGFEEETAMAAGINGGIVMVGASTSGYGVRKFANFIEFIYAVGSDYGIEWSEDSKQKLADVRRIASQLGKRRKAS